MTQLSRATIQAPVVKSSVVAVLIYDLLKREGDRSVVSHQP